MTVRDRTAADRHAVHRQGHKIIGCKETKWIDSSLRQCPVNLCGSRTYNVITRLASCSLIAAFLLVAGCNHHHYHDDDDGWRDGDRDHRHHHRYDRDDDRRYRDRDYR
ncbi:hypothetical protein D3C76_1106840 [compost metagenome]